MEHTQRLPPFILIPTGSARWIYLGFTARWRSALERASAPKGEERLEESVRKMSLVAPPKPHSSRPCNSERRGRCSFTPLLVVGCGRLVLTASPQPTSTALRRIARSSSGAAYLGATHHAWRTRAATRRGIRTSARCVLVARRVASRSYSITFSSTAAKGTGPTTVSQCGLCHHAASRAPNRLRNKRHRSIPSAVTAS